MNLRTRYRVRPAAGLLLFLCVLGTAAFAGAQGAPPPPDRRAADQFVSIDFNNVDINLFIKFISELTGTNFVVDPNVKGRVTIISPARISLDEAYRVFESVLEVNGFTTVKSGEIVKILPAPEARTRNIQTLLEQERATPEDKVVTQLIPLRFADPEEVKRLLTPLVSKNSVILGYAPANTLIITDVQSNIQRLMKILKQIDVPGSGQQISVIPLQYADAARLATQVLNNLFKPTGAPRPQGAPARKAAGHRGRRAHQHHRGAGERGGHDAHQAADRAARPRDPARQGQDQRLLLRARHRRGPGQGAAGDPLPAGRHRRAGRRGGHGRAARVAPPARQPAAGPRRSSWARSRSTPTRPPTA